MTRGDSWLAAPDEPYEPMPLRHGLALIACAAYGTLLVFLALDGHPGWFALAVLVPAVLYFAARAVEALSARIVARHVDCALFDDWGDQEPDDEWLAALAADRAVVERNWRAGGWGA